MPSMLRDTIFTVEGREKLANWKAVRVVSSAQSPINEAQQASHESTTKPTLNVRSD